MGANYSHCFYERDINNHPVRIINRHCGVSETHEVTTEDGYILTLFRIPKNNSKGVILFQHPLGADCKVWLSQFNESGAFYFWRNGYDVWLGNSRGTAYSKRHVNLSSEDLDFWNYSVHEIGYFDNEAIIKYIRSLAKQEKIIYVGYSISATAGLIYATTRSKEAANSVKLFVLLASPSHIDGTSVLRFIVPTFFNLNNRFHFVDNRERPWKENSCGMKLIKKLFKLFPFNIFFIYLMRANFGWNPDETDMKLNNCMITTAGSEVPYKVFEHFSQIYVAGGRFQNFDYGPEKNNELYGNENPPLYPLQKIKVPTVVMYGEKDNLTSSKGQKNLIENLPSSKIVEAIEVEGFAHNDFCYGRHRFDKVLNKILELLDKM